MSYTKSLPVGDFNLWVQREFEAIEQALGSIIRTTDGRLLSQAGWKPCYGSMTGEEFGWVKSSAAQNTWYEISHSGMSDGYLSSGVTHDGSGKLTIATAGQYLVSYSITFEVSGANKHMETAISISGTEQTPGQSHCETAAANLEVCIGSHAILNLSAAATVEISIRHTDTGAVQITVDDLNVVVVRL